MSQVNMQTIRMDVTRRAESAPITSDRVRAAWHGTIERHGLRLHTVSVSEPDRTPFCALVANNVFNAVGMCTPAEVTSKPRKERARTAAAGDKAMAKNRTEAKRGDAEALKLLTSVEAERARVEAENARSVAPMATERERSRLEAMPGPIEHLVKPAERIVTLSINHRSGHGGRGANAAGEARAASRVARFVDRSAPCRSPCRR